jgi:GNAT superfamily N-acetyltransferase
VTGRVTEDVVKEVNGAVSGRWQELDRLLPALPDRLERGAETLVTTRGDGYAVCRHTHIADATLEQTWGAKTRYVLRPRVAGPAGSDTQNSLDELLTQWREHLQRSPEARASDTAAVVDWPARDVTAVLALLSHGMQPVTMLAARPGREPAAAAAATRTGLVIREANVGDLDAVVAMDMGVIRYDAQFGGAILRQATEALVRADAARALAKDQNWSWLAEREGRPVGLLVVQPPPDTRWITPFTSAQPAAYLQTLFVQPAERGSGVGQALVSRAHQQLDAHGVAATLLHYAQVNPLSGPFWSRMGYRPLWTTWETRPAAGLR